MPEVVTENHVYCEYKRTPEENKNIATRKKVAALENRVKELEDRLSELEKIIDLMGGYHG